MDKITSKSDIRPELSAICFAPDKMVATDSFRLIEVKKDIDIKEQCLIKAKGFKGRGTVTIGDDDIVNDDGKLIQGERVDASYPEYERLLDLGVPKIAIHINGRYLAEIAAEVVAQAGDVFDKVTIEIYDPLKPVVIKAKGNKATVRGVVMPMTG